MTRDSYSYWLTVRTGGRPVTEDEREAILAAVLNNDELPLAETVHENPDPSGIAFEVDPDMGACEETGYLETLMKDWSKAFGPDFLVSCHAIDEDDRSEETYLVYRDGAKLFENHARVVPSDELYDEATVRSMLAYMAGRPEIPANLVGHLRTRFANPDWDAIPWDDIGNLNLP